jgi:hypothetical protein
VEQADSCTIAIVRLGARTTFRLTRITHPGFSIFRYISNGTDETLWKGLVVYFCERRRGPDCVPWPSANLDPFSAMPRLLSGRLLPWQRRSGNRRRSDEEVAGELSGADRGSPARVFSSKRRGAGIAASCIKAWSTASKKSFINIGTPSGASLD